MTNVTTILGDESGIQYQGVNDASSSTGTYPIIGLIVGKFKRGRFDKPMLINNGNIKAALGFDPENPDYVAVQDALSEGVASVQVLRLVAGYNEPEEPIEAFKPMIVSGLNVSSVSIWAYSPLDIDWGVQATTVFPEQSGVSEDTGKLYYIYGASYPFDYNGSGLQIKITHADGTSPIDGIRFNYLTNIDQWYSGGYKSFGAEGSGLGMHLAKVPDVIPPNTTNLDGMFMGAVYINDINISKWDYSEVVKMNMMLYGAQAFTHDMSKICVPKVLPGQADMFAWGTELQPEKLPKWGTCPIA
ncbi:MAG: DUF285 domain-containing protein [Candidatus Acinetobacter avistercoris]|nr:DUF285 domain-containing protein [Candidatus Acinetobacter avistercoris]